MYVIIFLIPYTTNMDIVYVESKPSPIHKFYF